MKKLTISGKDVSDYVLDWQEDAEFSDSLIGNVVVKQFTIKLDNENAGVTDWSNITAETTYKDGAETKTASQALTLTEKPERYSEDVTLTLYDRLYKTGKKYHSKLSYPAAISAIIAEIDDNIDTSSLPDSLLNRKVSKISGATKRDVLGYIAECAGCNVYCGANDKVRFSHVSMTYTAARTFDYASAFDVNRKITINRVGLDASDDEFYNVKDGKEDTTTPDSETLFLNPENPLVTQADCTYIYGQIGGKTVYSFKSFSTIKETGIDASIGLLDQVRPGTCIRYYTGTDGEKFGDAALMVMSAKRTEGAGDSEASWDLEGDLQLTHEDVVKQARTRGDTNKRIDDTAGKIKDVSDKVDKLQETVDTGGGGSGGGGLSKAQVKNMLAFERNYYALKNLIHSKHPSFVTTGCTEIDDYGTAFIGANYVATSGGTINQILLNSEESEVAIGFSNASIIEPALDAATTDDELIAAWNKQFQESDTETYEIVVGDSMDAYKTWENKRLPVVVAHTMSTTPITTSDGKTLTRALTVGRIRVEINRFSNQTNVVVDAEIHGQDSSSKGRVVEWAIVWPGGKEIGE